MRESIIFIRKAVDANELFIGGTQSSRQQEGKEIGRGRRVGTGGVCIPYQTRDDDKNLFKR